MVGVGRGGRRQEAGGRHDRGALWSATTERSDHLVGFCCLFVSSVKSLGVEKQENISRKEFFFGGITADLKWIRRARQCSPVFPFRGRTGRKDFPTTTTPAAK